MVTTIRRSALPGEPVRMTEEEFEAWCDEDVRAEFADGEVVLMPSAWPAHEEIFNFLDRILGLYVEQKALGKVLGSQVQVRLRAGLRRVPDLVFIAQERLGRIGERYIEGAPDVAIEVVSEDSSERDWKRKYAEYEEAGVREYWVVDPLKRQAAFYRLAESGRYEAVPLEEGVFRSEAIPGFWLRLEWLWPESRPRVLDVLRELGGV